MMFDHFDQVAEVDTDGCICSLDQIRKPSIWSSGDRSGLAWPNCNPKLRCNALPYRALWQSIGNRRRRRISLHL